MKKAVLVAAVCLLVVPVCAQRTPAVVVNDSIKTYSLPEIVVTATRTERDPISVGRSISVVSRASLNSSLLFNAAEALSQLEGLYIVGTGQNFGTNQNVFMRGAASNQTATMIDGVRITDPSGVDNAIDFSELSLAGLDRIEIVRGAHSTLYGSSAMGGVVNLLTRKNGLPGLHADADLRAGTFGGGASLFNQHLSLNYTDRSGFYLNGEVLNARVHGLDATVDTVTSPAAFNNRDRDGLEALDLLGKLGYKNDKLDLFIAFKRHNETKDIDQAAYVDDDNYTIDFTRNLLTYGASYRFSEQWKLKFLGGYSDMRRLSVDDSSVVDNAGNTDQTYVDQEWKGTMATNELQANVMFAGIEAVLGAGLYKETMGSKSYYYSNSIFGPFEFSTNLDTLGLNSSTKNLFAHFDLNGYLIDPSLEHFSLALGARLNDHSAFGRYATYEINPSYRLPDGVAYVSYSTGFNAPSLYQLFSPDRDFTSGITRGNSGLQPEESSSFEIGFKHLFGNGARFTFSYFRTVVEHSIEYAYLWDSNVPVEDLGSDFLRNDYRGDTYLNIGQQTTNGFELAVHAPLAHNVTVYGNLSLVSGRLVYTPSEIDRTHTQGNHVQLFNNGAFLSKEIQSTELVRRPNTLNVGVLYSPLAQWSVRLDVRHAGARHDVYYDSQRGPFGALGSVPVAEYTLVDLSQRYAFTQKLLLSARVENLFNTSYREINGFRTRGRGLYVSLRYVLDQAL